MSRRVFAILIGHPIANDSTDLQPANILLLLPGVDEVVKCELVEQLTTIYGFPKTIPLKNLPALPVTSGPLQFIAEGSTLHWVIGDLWHGTFEVVHH